MAIKMSYRGSGGNCPGQGAGHMGGSSGSYIHNMGKIPSGSAQKKSGGMGKSKRGNSPGPGSGHQPMGPNKMAKKGVLGLGRSAEDDY